MSLGPILAEFTFGGTGEQNFLFNLLIINIKNMHNKFFLKSDLYD